MCMEGYSGDATKGTPYDCIPSKIFGNLLIIFTYEY